MTVLRMYNEFLFIETMQCGYKELLLIRTFHVDIWVCFIQSQLYMWRTDINRIC